MQIAYDGTHYGGWQAQLNSTSIQTLIQNALETVLRVPISLTGSGRTDAGVHALGQIAHFCFEDLDLYKLIFSLNALLPKDIRIHTIELAPDRFHARYDATGKIYRYHLHLNPVMNPFKKLYTFHVREKIDLSLLQQATQLFIGTHDFTSFTNKPNQGSASNGAIRHLKRVDLVTESEGVYLELEANGFLYKMVRNIVGTLLDVAASRIPLANIPTIFSAKDRKKAGFTAPAQGLFLVKVLYD